MSNPPIAIVDPYSSGALLGPEFRRRGYGCLGVQSTREIPGIYRSTSCPIDLEEIVLHDEDLGTTAATLRDRGVQRVLAGCELGVDLADRLSERLSLRSNRPALRMARADKYLMTETVAGHGLRTAAQIRARQLAVLIDWARRREAWPVVAKPCQSTGSDAVHLCHSDIELGNAFEEILDHRNSLGRMNDSVLVQEFLDGTEYVIDTVSYSGRHCVTAFWRYGGRSSPAIGYDCMELLNCTGALQTNLLEYTFAALNALGIEYGPAHTEVMQLEDGLALVEVGARLNGGRNPQLSRACSGTSQVELTVESVVDPSAFLAQAHRPYPLDKHGILAFLIPHHRGRLKALPRLPEIRKLPSLHDLHVRPHPENMAPRVVGWVSLVHEDQAVVRRDLHRIRELEANGLYEIDARATRGIITDPSPP